MTSEYNIDNTTITVEPANESNKDKTKSKTDKAAPADTTWDAMARPGRPHPVWWHPWLATGWVGASGLLIDAVTADADWSWGHHLGITAAAAALGTVVGAAAADVTDDQRPLGMEAAALGTVTGAAAGIWGWIAAGANLATDPLQPAAWGGLALGGAAWAAWYAALRLRLVRARRSGSATAIKLSTKVHKGEYQQVMADAGFGAVEVLEVKSGFGGHTERAHLRLDPTRDDNSQKVLNAQSKIAGIMGRVFQEHRGVDLPDNAVTVVKVRSKSREVILDVKLTDISDAITPDMGEDITMPVTDPDTPLMLGMYLNSGEALLQPESGPHGVAVGASGSGKSTYFKAQVIGYMRRKHVALMAAGTSKFAGFLRPFITPVASGASSRSPFCMIGGGDGGTEIEAASAVKVLMSAYVLYRHRMTNKDLPRDDGGNIIPTADHPRVIVYIDEINDLVKRCKEDKQRHIKFRLPNGENLDVPAMLEAITSKGRSEGVELEWGSQRLTDTFLGMSGRDVTINTQRRAVFYTKSRSDASAVADKLDASQIEPKTLYMALSDKQEQQPAKVIYYDQENVATAMAAADANDTFGTLSGAEAAALGELWSGRWSRDRIGALVDTITGAECLIADNDTTVAPGPAAAASSRDTNTSEAGAGRSARLDAAIARAKAEAAGNNNDGGDSATENSLDAAQRDMYQQVMADLDALPTTETVGGAPMTVPREAPPADILSAVLALIGDQAGAAPMDLLVGLGWINNDGELDKAEYNAVAGHLRDMLRVATGDAGLATRQIRLTDGSRDRWWMRKDLDGGTGQ